MNGMTLIWSALMRHKARSVFAFLSVVAAFVLFSVLASVRHGMYGRLVVSVAQRLDVNSKVGGFMPVSYYQKIATVPGVTAVTYLNGFNGYYEEPNNRFRLLFFNVEPLFKVYTKFRLPPAQARVMRNDRQGAIAGPALTKRMGWKVGETIPVQGGPAQKDGSTTWYFHLDGIYQADLPNVYQNFFVGHYRYFNEGMADPKLQNVTFQYQARIADPREGPAISAAIDKLFENASPQTLTQSEQIEALSQIRQFGNISAMVIYVGLAVFFTLLLIIGNTFAESVRERTGEFAMLRALGFRRLWIVSLVAWEALILVIAGGIVGLIVGYFICHALYPVVGAFLPTFGLAWGAAGVGIAVSIACGLIAAGVPMRRVSRLRVAEALRST